jgi:hypothetical protein
VDHSSVERLLSTDNLEFTLTFANFEEASFRAALAQLFGITDVDDLELSIIRGRTLVDGGQVIQCELWGPNAVIDTQRPRRAWNHLAVGVCRPAAAAPEDGASRLHWVLSGVVVFDGVCICCACAGNVGCARARRGHHHWQRSTDRSSSPELTQRRILTRNHFTITRLGASQFNFVNSCACLRTLLSLSAIVWVLPATPRTHPFNTHPTTS